MQPPPDAAAVACSKPGTPAGTAENKAKGVLEATFGTRTKAARTAPRTQSGPSGMPAPESLCVLVRLEVHSRKSLHGVMGLILILMMSYQHGEYNMRLTSKVHLSS